MTVGSPKLIVRIPAQVLGEIRDAIAKRNRRTRDEPWDVSAFVRCAIRDKLHHLERSRRKRPARRSGEPAVANNEG